jgi:phosphonate transport system substrate-binding protein
MTFEQTMRANGAEKMNLSRNSIHSKSPEKSAAGRMWQCALLIILILLGTMSFADDETLKAREEQHLVLGFMNDVFSDVNVADALAATKVWATELKRKKGFDGPADAVVYTELDTALEALKSKRVDMVVLVSWQYLQLIDQADIEPHFVTGRGENIAEETILLVHQKSGIQSLEDLKGKKLLILNNVRASLGRIWLETCLMENGIGDIDSYFSKITGTQKSSKTVLPVFFGQSDACLIHRSGFETMSELNPQLRRDLKIIAMSPPILPSILCVRRDYHEPMKSALIDAMAHLHDEPRGLQILTLFKVNQVHRFSEKYLEAAKELLVKHSTLKKQLQQEGEQGEAASTRISRNVKVN